MRHGERGRRRFDGRRYGLLSGTWIVFQDAPLAAVIRAEDEEAVIRALERGGVPAELWQGRKGST